MNRTGGIFAAEARLLGKSARTRARLMDAAAEVFARDGYEAASVNEIARIAQVANGTFYAHFKDKNAVVAAVTFRIAGDVVSQLNAAMAGVEDAVERVARATRQFVHLACSEPDWGWALLRAVTFLPDLRAHVITYLRADLERGVAQGVFDVTVEEVLLDTFAAMVVSALFGRLRGDVGLDPGSRVAELQLRMLGVSADRATAAAWAELEPLKLELPAMARPD